MDYIYIYIWAIYNGLYVIYTTWAAVLYQIYKHEPKASGCISDTTRTRMLYIAYDTPTSKCSCLSTILKVSDIQPPSCHWFPLSFLRELLMSIINIYIYIYILNDIKWHYIKLQYITLNNVTLHITEYKPL